MDGKRTDIRTINEAKKVEQRNCRYYVEINLTDEAAFENRVKIDQRVSMSKYLKRLFDRT